MSVWVVLGGFLAEFVAVVVLVAASAAWQESRHSDEPECHICGGRGRHDAAVHRWYWRSDEARRP